MGLGQEIGSEQFSPEREREREVLRGLFKGTKASWEV